MTVVTAGGVKLRVVTTTDLADGTHAVNTTDKRAGLTHWASDGGLHWTASGSGATDPWYPSDGGSAITPTV